MLMEEETLANRVKHFCSEVWDSICLLGEGLTDVSVWSVVFRTWSVKFYVLAMLYVAYLLGVSPWATIILPITPLFTLWLWVQWKRERNYWALILGPQKEWNIDKVLKEYTELLEKQKKRKQRKLVEPPAKRVFSIFMLNSL